MVWWCAGKRFSRAICRCPAKSRKTSPTAGFCMVSHLVIKLFILSSYFNVHHVYFLTQLEHMLYRTIFEEIAQRVATNFDLQQRHNKSPTWEFVERNKMGLLFPSLVKLVSLCGCIEILQSFIVSVNIDNLILLLPINFSQEDVLCLLV